MKATNDNYIDSLPHEVELYLFSFFDIADLPNVASVSKVDYPPFIDPLFLSLYATILILPDVVVVKTNR